MGHEGCLALDYLRSESDAEPRRAFVHAVKAGDPAALDHVDREQPPLAGDTLERVGAAVVELDPRTGTIAGSNLTAIDSGNSSDPSDPGCVPIRANLTPGPRRDGREPTARVPAPS